MHFRLAPGHRAHDYYLEIIDPEAGAVLPRSLLPGVGYYELADATTLIRGWEEPDPVSTGSAPRNSHSGADLARY